MLERVRMLFTCFYKFGAEALVAGLLSLVSFVEGFDVFLPPRTHFWILQCISLRSRIAGSTREGVVFGTEA